MLPALFCNPCTTIVDCHTQEFLATSTTSVTSIILHNTPQGLPNRLPCLTSYPPGHVPPIFFPLQRKSTGFHSKANWIYETVTTIISLPLPPISIPLQQKARGAISEVHRIYGTVAWRVYVIITFPEQMMIIIPFGNSIPRRKRKTSLVLLYDQKKMLTTT